MSTTGETHAVSSPIGGAPLGHVPQSGPADVAEAFVRAFKITYPSIYDPTGKTLLAFAGQLPPSAVPSTMIIDAQGRLAVRVLGEISTITLVAMIDDVASGK